MLKQKFRIQWLKIGDRNNAFFFKSINQLRNRSPINHLSMDDSSSCFDKAKIKETFVDYYTQLLGSPRSSEYKGPSRLSPSYCK